MNRRMKKKHQLQKLQAEVQALKHEVETLHRMENMLHKLMIMQAVVEAKADDLELQSKRQQQYFTRWQEGVEERMDKLEAAVAEAANRPKGILQRMFG